MNTTSVKYAGAAMLAALVYAGSAQAQNLGSGGQSWINIIAESLENAWSKMVDYTTPSSNNLVTKSLIHEGKSGTSDFKEIMDGAGYKVKEVMTGIGLVPYFSLTFAQARELSEADVEYVRRLLRKHERMYSSPFAIAERTIVRAVLDVQELRGYKLEKVNVDMLPLPSVKFYGTPVDAPVSEETSRVLQAIERLNETLVKTSSNR